jgi:ADP-dependent NAD(P)H-hydrate dehydratase / NAD(P)H-hydrate epimerase
MRALGKWATGILLIGDAGRNSETSILYEEFIRNYDGPLTITRDAIDLIKNDAINLVERPNTMIIASFAQLQKIFQSVYYPKILTFSMQLSNLVETIHKFTISYPVTIAVFHQDQIIVTHNGQVTSTPYSDPMRIWRGITATYATSYWLWNTAKPLESVTASLLK